MTETLDPVEAHGLETSVAEHLRHLGVNKSYEFSVKSLTACLKKKDYSTALANRIIGIVVYYLDQVCYNIR